MVIVKRTIEPTNCMPLFAQGKIMGLPQGSTEHVGFLSSVPIYEFKTVHTLLRTLSRTHVFIF